MSLSAAPVALARANRSARENEYLQFEPLHSVCFATTNNSYTTVAERDEVTYQTLLDVANHKHLN